MSEFNSSENFFPQTGEIFHRVTNVDAQAVAAMRPQVLPFKGQLTSPQGRDAFDHVIEQTPGAAGVFYEAAEIGGVLGFWCHPESAAPNAAILYLHGGAYVLGSAAAYRHFGGQIASRTGVSLFIPDYRLAPEHVFPAAVEDALSVYGDLAKAVSKIAVMGDSAGGGLALALLQVVGADDSPAPRATVALSAWTDLALTGASMDALAEDDPLVTRTMLDITGAQYLNGHDARDPRASPLFGALNGLPPVQLHVGTFEVLLDDTRRYLAAALAADVEAMGHIWEGMPHVFPASIGVFEAAESALKLISHFLKEKLEVE